MLHLDVALWYVEKIISLHFVKNGQIMDSALWGWGSGSGGGGSHRNSGYPVGRQIVHHAKTKF